MPLGLDTVTDLPSSPAATLTEPGEEARRNYGRDLTSAAPPTNKDGTLAEGTAEMGAADRLEAAAPANDASLADGIADASAAGQPAPPADEARAAEDPLVVVRVHAKRAALESKTFDQLLERSGIEVDSAADDSGATTVDESTRSARRYAENGQALAAVVPAPDQVKDDATVEAVLVEASPAAIAACMDGLSKDQENFVGLFVDDTSTVKAQSAAESTHNPEVFAKLKVAENLELSKYNRGVVPAEQESLDRDKYYSYGNDGAGFGGGRFGGAGGGERDLQQRQQERLFRARNTLTDSNAGLAVRLKWGTETQPQPATVAQQTTRGGLAGKNAPAAAAFKAQNSRRELKETEQAAADNKLQVLFLFSCEDPAVATPTAPSRGKAQ
jgi:hypothetical protein